jgi:hypothetical protein
MSHTVGDALAKSKQVKENVKRAADDLTVVHAVLDKEIPEGERSAEVNQAVQHTDQVEKKLQESVKTLEGVTKTLEAEVKRRVNLESNRVSPYRCRA